MIERIKKILLSNETYAGTCEDWDIFSLLQIVIDILKEKKGGIGGEVPKEKVDAIAEMILPDIIAFFQTEEGKAVFEKAFASYQEGVKRLHLHSSFRR
jgi:hypothetical protein